MKRKSFISEFDKLILSNAIVFEDLLKSFGNNHADVYIEIDTEKYSLNEVKNKVLNYIKSYVYQIYEI